jgi:hypothetical protein
MKVAVLRHPKTKPRQNSGSMFCGSLPASAAGQKGVVVPGCHAAKKFLTQWRSLSSTFRTMSCQLVFEREPGIDEHLENEIEFSDEFGFLANLTDDEWTLARDRYQREQATLEKLRAAQ